ncbi:MAG: hypothetical protein WDZ67_00375 [Patescibacteria group bacterium]
MKASQVMMLRLSKKWAKSDPLIFQEVAKYLYAFYSFLQLADQDSSFGWAVGEDKQTKETYLVLLEINPDSNSEDQEGGDFSIPNFEDDIDVQMEDETPADELGEEDLDPDLRGEVKDV